MMSIPSDGSPLQSERLTTSESHDIPQHSSPDGAFLLFRRDHGLLQLNLTDRTIRPWYASPFNDHGARFSPDGHWVTYSSDQTGRMEIWIRPFSGPGGPRRVSSEGGHDPVWPRDGREIFYENGGKLYSARVIADGTALRVDPAVMLFEGGFAARRLGSRAPFL
jgi:Tol biopolymer transport system component